VIDELKKRREELEMAKLEAVQNVGIIVGRVEELNEIIAKLEAERKVVDITGKPVETAAKGNKPEKR
jgi:hypothetical protein